MKTDFELIHLAEPMLSFGHCEEMEDPRHGLSLLGPFETRANYSVSYGVIGSTDGVRRLKDWVEKLQKPIAELNNMRGRPPFPGFEAAFGIAWHSTPLAQIPFEEQFLRAKVYLDDVNKRVHETVGFFVSRIIQYVRQQDNSPALWVVVIPDFVYQYCRPKMEIPKPERITTDRTINRKTALKVGPKGFLFPESNEEAAVYQYEPDFHNQLKGRLLKEGILTQIVKESTLAPDEILKANGKPKYDYSGMLSQIAWNLSSAVYYKVAGRPWKLNGVRPGVCYIGLVFKRDEKHRNTSWACCAAQMFLDSGDGVVFRGHNGPWRSASTRQFHLSSDAAEDLMSQAILSYRQNHSDEAPKEIFIHGRTQFDDDEWRGFEKAAGEQTRLVGVRITDAKNLRLFRYQGGQPVMRGLAWIQSNEKAILMTRGYQPSLGTYPGMEVPLPLEVEVVKGVADIKQVLQDILGLTKLNYNSCRFADGYPVTLKFADAVGEVLLSGPQTDVPPLPFKHYI